MRSSAHIQAVSFELHGQHSAAPDIVSDAFGTVQDMQVAGTTEEMWRANSGWFTSAGDNGTIAQGGWLPSDDFFRLDSWRSLFFSCWLRYPPNGQSYTVWSYGNPNNGTTGGIGFSAANSERVRLQFSNGVDSNVIAKLTDIALDDGQMHLVGGYFFQHDGAMYTQVFIDGIEQGMDSLPSGNFVSSPNLGFGLFCRVSNAGLAVNQMVDGMQISDMAFYRSMSDLRLFTLMRMRQTFEQGRATPPTQDPRA